MQEKFEKQCQSCGMPLEAGAKSGTEVDGSKSHTFCNLCYANGQFIDPDMTLEKMKQICNDALKQKGWIAPLRWAAMWQLPTLKRWRVDKG